MKLTYGLYSQNIPEKIARYIDRAKKLDLDRSPEKWYAFSSRISDKKLKVSLTKY